MPNEAQKRASAKWDKENMKVFVAKFEKKKLKNYAFMQKNKGLL